ncbi:MAG: UUP1 family membrane protein, partial [Candidatus Methylumidiphilus sp.]
FTVVDENFVSSNYGLTTEDDGVGRNAQWAVRKATGYQVLYYRLHLARDPTAQTEKPSPPPALAPPEYPEMIRSAVLAVIEEARGKSADTLSFSRELLLRLNAATPDANISLLRQDMQTQEDWVSRIVDILAGAGIPARMTHILRLVDGSKHAALTPWIEVYAKDDWQPFNPQTAEPGTPKEAIIWHVGKAPVLSVLGGKFPKVEYSVTRHAQEMTLVAEQRARQMGSRIMEFSLFSLPVQTQNVYRILLLTPIGAFLIVLMRNVVGFKTFGTFMPILIALAFRETKLLWGMALFTLVVGLGLAIRFYLEYLKLLLVPRLAAMLTIVILLMALVSLMSHKLGIDRGVSVALFPMVIMTMTVERMALVWEEMGPLEALQQGFGSLLVAALGFSIMSDKLFSHMVFVFPELLLIVLAANLLLGRYTGYRLTELWRFRAALRQGQD